MRESERETYTANLQNLTTDQREEQDHYQDILRKHLWFVAIIYWA